jgi:hypothetical protein
MAVQSYFFSRLGVGVLIGKIVVGHSLCQLRQFPREISRAIRRMVVNSMAKAGLPAKKLPISPIGFDEVCWPLAKPFSMV